MTHRASTRASSLLARLQLGLEALYRVETQLAIDAFVIDGDQRDQMRPARAPREQLLLREADGELAMALFVDAAALANLEQHDPAARLDDENFTDFCLAVEGVSHFVYVALRAARSRPVSQLELELQAEVDKFVCCVLRGGHGGRACAGGSTATSSTPTIWTPTSASATAPPTAKPAATRRRWSAASSRASRPWALLAELRRFYRMDLPDKLGRIAQLA